MIIQVFTVAMSMVFCDAAADFWKGKDDSSVKVACAGVCAEFGDDSLVQVVLDYLEEVLQTEIFLKKGKKLYHSKISAATSVKTSKAGEYFTSKNPDEEKIRQVRLDQQTMTYPLLKGKQRYESSLEGDSFRSGKKGGIATSTFDPTCLKSISTQFANFWREEMSFFAESVPKRRMERIEAASARIQFSVQETLHLVGSLPALQVKGSEAVPVNSDAISNTVGFSPLIIGTCLELLWFVYPRLPATLLAEQVANVISDGKMLDFTVQYRSKALQNPDSVKDWIDDLAYHFGSQTLAATTVLTALLSTEDVEVSKCTAQKFVTKFFQLLMQFGTNAVEALNTKGSWRELTHLERTVVSRFLILCPIVEDLDLKRLDEVDNAEMSMGVA